MWGLSAWRRWREDACLKRRPIPDAAWQATLLLYPFLAARPVADLLCLRRLATLFLARKEFAGAGGLAVTDEMAVAIAAQACLPILSFGLEAYDHFIGIVVHPDLVVAQRRVEDEDGVVHDYEEELAGEAMLNGPVMLSWSDVRDAGATAEDGYNAVIHEFAHVLDMRFGWTAHWADDEGDARREGNWLMRAYLNHVERVDAGHEDLLLDPYGAEAPEEFLAVASEVFFVNPRALRRESPELYAGLATLYRQDPAPPP